MTSQKSFQNNFGFAYRTGIKDNIVVGVVGALFLSIFFAYIPIMAFTKMTKKTDMTFMLTQEMEFLRYLVIVAMLGLGIFMGIMAFRFITGKKTVNVFYSLGIKRTSLFTAKFLSGITVLAIAVLVPMLISVISNIVFIGFNSYLIKSALYIFVGLFSLAFVSYSITSLIFSMVGTAFEGMVFSGVVVLLPQIVLTCLEALIQKLVFGTPYGQSFSQYSNYQGDYTVSLVQKFPNINPIRYFANGLYTYSTGAKDGGLTDYNNGENILKWSNPNYLPVLCWLAFAVAVSCVAVFVYKNRKAEIGGFIGKNKPLNFITTFVAGFFAFVLTVTGLSLSNTVCLLIGLGVFAVVYIIFMLLILRDKHQFVKTLYFLPIQLAITLLIFAFFATDYFGTANKIPEISTISYAQVSTISKDDIANENLSFSYYDSSVYSASSPSYASGKYESENDIKFVTELNSMIVEQGKKQPTSFANDFNQVYPAGIQIKYVLKDGKEIYKYYYGIEKQIIDKLLEIDGTDYYKARLKDIFYGSYNPDLEYKENMTTQEQIDYQYNSYKLSLRDDSSLIAMSNKLFGGEENLELSHEQRLTLLDCLYKDLTAQTTAQRYNPEKTLGIMMFINTSDNFANENKGMYYSTSYSGDVDMEQPIQASVSSYQNSWYNAGKPSYIITEDMKNTVGFLKSIGYFDNFTLSDDDIKSVKILKIGDIFSSGFFKQYYNDRMVFTKATISNDFYGIFSNFSMYDSNSYISKAYSVTDKNVQNSLIENGVLRGQATPDDYIIMIVKEKSYSTLLVNASKVPDQIKTAANNIDLSSVYN